MHSIRLQALLLVSISVACRVPEPPIPLKGDEPIVSHPAFGCWELRAVRGRSMFLPGVVRVHLDTTPARPDDTRMLLTAHIDSGTVRRIWGRKPIVITHWAPYRTGDRIFLLFGDGVSALDMRLRVQGDLLHGFSAYSTDIGWWDTDGPEIEGRRISCT